MNHVRARLCILLLLVTMLGGCGIIDYLYLPVPEDTAQELWEAGVDNMNATNYYKAARYFTQLRDRYPFSPYTAQAELALGDALYLNGDYEQAMDAYLEFEMLHPRHEEMPYVLYQIGVSGYKSFTTIDRPQPLVAQGIEYLRRLQETYPQSVYAQQAGEYIKLSREILAKRELFVADFYWKRERYSGAWNRYTYVAENFGDLPEYQEYAKRQAELSYLRFQQQASEMAMRQMEGSWRDYFYWL
ncbi:outer membrane protein assembly factor BamD [Oceanidesulfovibrio marinus]|uniref:Outer membrane protein assembly factor BamD n=1 Tax=Oceanidesulfovibrio marinus TaxID=370038 RepID=A0A6P1ZJD9_9BACT|nr:outer membrane protein assembly factor BamD [Oceanidesulfovibrio marinus]QJT08216.1 outer membrane protein assembly factor BamD [Oceanidesulfovibrio marinus]TVM35111.1 outer membrane protein assembly factor BamD [Oceanidesulfovibrio marinus]